VDLHPQLQALEAELAVSPLQQINDPFIAAHGLELWIKRDDLLHPIISGNKWRKLKYILNHALHNQAERIVSMGGQYSNHLHALAYVGKCLNLKTAAFIRGERPSTLTPTLADLKDWGMELRFISRSQYRELRQYTPLDGLPELVPGDYWLAEGGANQLALQGLRESVAEISMSYDVLAVACGTGTTLAGLISAVPADCQVLGIAALKAGFMSADVENLLQQQGINRNNWQISQDYHLGGFAETSPALLAFIHNFEQCHGIPIEPVYTGKLLYAVYDLILRGTYTAGQRLVVLHTGGLQGKR
jgi:1-aminocyclopropane-1-carboxylate deaminase